MNVSSVLLVLTALLCTVSDAARILVIVAAASKSHKMMFSTLMESLAHRGHTIVAITVVKFPKPIPGIAEIEATEMEDTLSEIAVDMYSTKTDGSYGFIKEFYYNIMPPICAKFMNNSGIQGLIKSKDHFDVVLYDGGINECFLGFVHKFKAPLIVFGIAGPLTYCNEAVGNPNNYAYLPNTWTSLPNKMNFYQRMKNLLISLHLKYVREYYYMPQLEKILRPHFGEDMPPLLEIERNASMLFNNAHFSMNTPVPYVPAAIDVGAMHCRPAKPLPKDIEDFIAGSGDAGFIYFSMGTALPASMMPENSKVAFQEAFSKLKQRVIWKWEENMSDKPQNVMTGKWLPQQDILGHPKIRLFIAHGGLFGTQESTYHGVPMILIPMIGDQEINSRRVVRAGYGLRLDFHEITSDLLLDAINAVMNNNSYKENVQRVSRLLRDQPETPLERAVFWTEYVIRHRGARHLRTAAMDLSWYQWTMLDVIAFLLLAVFTLIATLFFVLRALFKWTVMSKKKRE